LAAGGQVCRPFVSSNPTTYGCTVPPSTISTLQEKPTAFFQVWSYLLDNQLFLDDFAESFSRMTTVGYGLPKNVDGAQASGKLGSLTAIDLKSCPTNAPTLNPTSKPTSLPTTLPTSLPTKLPTTYHTTIPTASPTTKTTASSTLKTKPPPSPKIPFDNDN
jgi:hypothetical protein